MQSTFSSFYVAKSGLQAAQANLHITGQNMTNVDTKGYTRQRVNTVTVGSSSSGMRYANKTDLSLGGGVECTGVGQIRDPYLDIQYRMASCKVGDTEAQLETLNYMQNLTDETKNQGLDARFTDLLTQMRTFASSSTDTITESIVKNSSLLLVQMFNNTSSQIKEIQDEQVDSLQTNMVDKVNNLLKNIASLNEQIKSSDISGNAALELRDSRNSMIDELSQYVNIEISSKPVAIGGGETVDEMQVDLLGSGKKFNLISDDEYKQFSLQKDADGKVTFPVTIKLKNFDGTPVTASNDGSAPLTDGDINGYLTSGKFSGALKMLNGKGDFAGAGESAERGISYYVGLFDNLAQTFADMMNSANSTSVSNTNPPTYNKPLFTTTDGTTTSGITAQNISLSSVWKSKGDTYITSTKTGTTGDNVLAIVSEFSKKRTFKTASGKSLFTGTFQEQLTNISTTLGLQIQDVARQNTTYNSNLDDVDTNRQAVSSVDINDEGVNLIMYNQAFTAASRFMTTMDEAIDTIINKMGIVGRS